MSETRSLEDLRAERDEARAENAELVKRGSSDAELIQELSSQMKAWIAECDALREQVRELSADLSGAENRWAVAQKQVRGLEAIAQQLLEGYEPEMSNTPCWLRTIPSYEGPPEREGHSMTPFETEWLRDRLVKDDQ